MIGEALAEGFIVGFKILMFIVRILVGLFSWLIRLVLSGGSKALESPPADIAKHLQEVKIQLTNGAIVEAMDCPDCKTVNEIGQIACYACGQSLYPSTKIQTIPDGTSPVTTQWMLLAGVAWVGILLIFGGNQFIGLVGFCLLVACGVWGFSLLRLNLSK